MKKLGLVFLLLVAGLGAWAFASRKNGEGDESGARYRVEAVGRGAIVASVSATGTVTPTTTVIVGSQLSGQVVEILADYNSEVKAGQVLARLNRDTLLARRDAARADLAQARAARQLTDAQAEKTRADLRKAEAQQSDMQAQLARAEALLVDAETTFERQNSLKARGIATDVTLQSATTQRATQGAAKRSAEAQIASSRAQIAALEADLKVVEAQKLSGDALIAKAEAQVRQIEVDLANSEIKAPVDGVVIQRNVELGQTVAASLQSPTLFLVAQNLRLIEIYVNVDESDVGRVRPGQEVEFTVNAYMARTFRGRVKQIRLGSQTVQNVVIYTTIVAVPNDDMALLPGMTANLRIFTERKGDVLRVPNAALRWQPASAARNAGWSSGGPPPEPLGGGEDPAGPFAAGPAAAGAGFQGQMLAELKAELALTPAQMEEAGKLARAMRTEIQAAGSDPAARREAARAARQTFSRALEALLEPAQREKYKAFQEARRGRGGPGNAGPGRNATAGTPGRVHVLDERGNPRVVELRLGATDGAFTEILGGTLTPEDRVIVGAVAPKSAQRGSAFRFGF
jgi:HlyD family secretion protein